MNTKDIITEDMVKPLLDEKFIRVFDLQYEEGKHYFDATRRTKEELVATKPEDDFNNLMPDAVSCIVILHIKDKEPVLLLSYEYRYPVGHYLLGVPAGLIDPADKLCKNRDEAIIKTATRELFEETGIRVADKDSVKICNPCLFSTPGMTDECNALAVCDIYLNDTSALTQEGAEGSEKFSGFWLLTKEDARNVLNKGTDEYNHAYSIYTFAALMYFLYSSTV